MLRKLLGTGKSGGDTRRYPDPPASDAFMNRRHKRLEGSESPLKDAGLGEVIMGASERIITMEDRTRVYSVCLVLSSGGKLSVSQSMITARSEHEALGIALEKDDVENVIYKNVMVVSDEMVLRAYRDIPAGKDDEEETDAGEE